MARLQLVSIGWIKTTLDTNLGDSLAGGVGDWIRLTPYTWIVWTDKTTFEVSQVFRSKLTPDDVVVVMNLDARNAAGVAPQWVWNWINSKILLQRLP